MHDSLLPRYRGFAPLVSQLVNGETEIGVSAIWAKNEYDTGEIITQSSIAIEYPIKMQQAIDAISGCYVECLLQILSKIQTRSEIHSVPQDESLATYSLWRDDCDYWINWHDDADRIARFVDAVCSPYKGARSLCNGILVTIHQVQVVPDARIENRTPGKVFRFQDGLPVVVCGSGLVLITNAVESAANTSILPLKLFRSRFYAECCQLNPTSVEYSNITGLIETEMHESETL